MTPKYPNGIAAARDVAGLIQADAAAAAGISLTAYRTYEWGKRDVPASVVKRLAEVFKCSPLDILGEGPSFPTEGLRDLLSDDELRLLRTYRALDKRLRAHVMDDAQIALRSQGR